MIDFTALSGLIFGLIIIVAGIAMGQVPLSTILNPEAILVVFGGTLTATLVSFDQNTLSRAIDAMVRCFYKQQLTIGECVTYMMDVVSYVRKQGVLSLNSTLGHIDIPFLKKGLSLVIDNRDEQFIRNSLSTELEVVYREEMDYARVFETAGGYAPTMGIIGAVIGLIHVVSSFDDPAQLGMGIAQAFSATLYGVALANLLLLPLAGKLKQKARDQWLMKTLLLEGIVSIRNEEHPYLVEEKLTAFLSPAMMAASNNTQSVLQQGILQSVRQMPQPAALNRNNDYIAPEVRQLETALDNSILSDEPLFYP